MIELRLLGGADLQMADGADPSAILAHPKRLALLAYLAAGRPFGFHQRDALVALLWPNLDQGHARGALRQTLLRLRQSVGKRVVVTRGDEAIGLDANLLWCDVRAFDVELSGGRPDEALALYRGDFLPGVFDAGAPEFERWIDGERRGLRLRATRAAWLASDQAEQAGDTARCAEWAQRAVRLAPDDEPGARRLITLLERVGDRAGASRACDELERYLKMELEVAPSADTTTLLAMIRGNEAPAEPALSAADPVRIARAVTREGPDGDRRVIVPRVTRVPSKSDESLPDGQPASRALVRSRRTVLVALAAAAIVLLVGRTLLPRATTSAEEQSVAVLPFVNATGSREDDYLSEGMTDELTSALVSMEGLRVASRSSAYSFRGKRAEATTVGTKLGVSNVVEGAMSRIGTRIHVTAQLIRAADGRTLWSESFERTADSVFNLQRDVAARIVGALRLHTDYDAEQAFSFGTLSPEAHDLYTKGRFYWNKRSASTTEAAIPFFEQAIAKDSLYARAYAGLSDSYSYLAMFGGALPSTLADKAKQAATKALSLAPQSPDAITSMGLYHLTFDWDWRAVDQRFSEAIRLRPRWAQVRLYNAFYLLAMGKTDAALEETKRAEEVEPFFQIATARVGQFYYFDHRYDQAIRQLRKALEFDSTYRIAQASAAFAFSQLGQHDSAIAWASKSVRSPDRAYGPSTSVLGTAYGLAGRRADALGVVRELHKASKQHYVPPINFAMIFATLNESDSVFFWLERSYADRNWSVTYALADPIFDGFHADPRWEPFVRKVRTQ
jgi:TolB-like protein/DNA-binding SARP family transcriptional activator